MKGAVDMSYFPSALLVHGLSCSSFLTAENEVRIISQASADERTKLMLRNELTCQLYEWTSLPQCNHRIVSESPTTPALSM
jgi:hypothetical protein